MPIRPENCSDTNLKAWCQRCHLNYDKEHHAQTRAQSSRCKYTLDIFEAASC